MHANTLFSLADDVTSRIVALEKQNGELKECECISLPRAHARHTPYTPTNFFCKGRAT
jgi:hypothetical protein